MYRIVIIFVAVLSMLTGCTIETKKLINETSQTTEASELITSTEATQEVEVIEVETSINTTTAVESTQDTSNTLEGENVNMERIASFLTINKNVQMATVATDGKPAIRTIWFQLYENERLYFQTDVEASLYKDLIQSPFVEFVSANNDYTQTLRVKGEVVIEDNSELVAHVLTKYPIIKKHYDNIGNPKLMMFYIDKGTASIFEFSDERQETILFYEW